MDPKPRTGERTLDAALRPRSFAEYLGQEKLKANLAVFVEAAKKRGEALDHMLFCGPPGLGKTTMALLLAEEMGVEIHTSSGPVIERKGELASLLTRSQQPRRIIFIDEIHRLNPAIEESLYPAMEDFSFDIVMGEGLNARSMRLPLERFTLIGATTRTGLLTSPMRNRFGFIARLEYYTPEELEAVIHRSAGLLGVRLDTAGASEIARRARGTPRIANRLLRRVRDFADVEGDGTVDVRIARSALDRLEVDSLGLEPTDRDYLLAIIEKFEGGPVGVDTLAAALSEERNTLEDVVEPFLLQQGFLQRTPRGRVATSRAYRHLGLRPPRRKAPADDLFV
ncbi:MAG: Holliday junction branch migration DNA helicase RuvB [Deltaproteobacteria bacterium]|nr:Holliday junction branch migration DNA helicase RuvB [Deltaproteobacteria bacterium]